MPKLPLADCAIHYELHGTAGPPVVLVHGYTGDVSDWRHQIADLAPDHRVLVMDQRGHGRSSAPRDRASYTIERMADDVAALLDAVAFERFHLVGHSMGGMVAQELALRAPERLLSLVLEDTGPDFAVGRIDAVRKLFAERLRVAEEQGMAAVADLPSPPRPPHHPRERAEQERARLAAMSLDGFAGGWQALCEWPGTRDRVDAIRTPTLVVYGELDVMVVAGSQWLAENVPGAAVEKIPEAGHSPQFERPDLFNAALRRHFARAAAG
jgi:pimeloyl-ACP methyl ester carboxylesterase